MSKTTKPLIAIINYGVGNLHSVRNALEKVCGNQKDIVFSHDPQTIAQAEKLILPGVGHFETCVKALEKHPLCAAELKRSVGKKAILGICVGMQLLFRQSEEGSEISPDGTLCHQPQGLGLFQADVVQFERTWQRAQKEGKLQASDLLGLKSPQMGWNEIEIEKKARHLPLFDGIQSGYCVYFANQFFVPKNQHTLAHSNHGLDITAVVGDVSQKLYGFQFHPEKSSQVGLKLLENFLFKV